MLRMTGHAPADGRFTLILTPGQVRLGDITDHFDGPLCVTEITQRRDTWTLGGRLYADYSPQQELDPPPLVRHVPRWVGVRVMRRPPHGEPLRTPGHTRSIKSHDPVRRGCYTHVAGWNASCSCDWTSPGNPWQGKKAASDAFLSHQVDMLTTATMEQHPSLARIEEIEQKLGERLPWQWTNKRASIELTGDEEAVHVRLSRWAAALGSEVAESENGRYASPHRRLRVATYNDTGWSGGTTGFELWAEFLKTDALI